MGLGLGLGLEVGFGARARIRARIRAAVRIRFVVRIRVGARGHHKLSLLRLALDERDVHTLVFAKKTNTVRVRVIY